MNLPTNLQGLQQLAASDALAKASKVLPRIAVVLLVALIAWQSARLTWAMLPRRTVIAPVAIPQVTSANRTFSPQRIVDAHLFGVPNASDAADIANAPQTQIPLVLAGTIPTSEPTIGYAFIGESAANAKFLKVGQSVAGQATLHSVYPDRVMLDRGGRLEALMLPRQSSGVVISNPVQTMTPPPARFAENLKRTLETNPAAFSEIVRPQAFISQGQMQGFRVYPGRNRQQFAKLGFQPGDLVKAINGTPLDDPQRSGEIFNTLSASDRAQITIERNGQVQTLTLNTAQIELPDPVDPTMDPRAAMPPQERQFDPAGASVQ